MAIWSSLGQLEISRRSKYVAVIITCCKWRLYNCVEARFKYLSDLNAFSGIQQYSFPVPDRSSSSQSFSIRRYLLMTFHHTKQVPAALAKSLRSRNRNTKIKITGEISISGYSSLSLILVRQQVFLTFPEPCSFVFYLYV